MEVYMDIFDAIPRLEVIGITVTEHPHIENNYTIGQSVVAFSEEQIIALAEELCSM